MDIKIHHSITITLSKDDIKELVKNHLVKEGYQLDGELRYDQRDVSDPYDNYGPDYQFHEINCKVIEIK